MPSVPAGPAAYRSDRRTPAPSNSGYGLPPRRLGEPSRARATSPGTPTPAPPLKPPGAEALSAVAAFSLTLSLSVASAHRWSPNARRVERQCDTKHWTWSRTKVRYGIRHTMRHRIRPLLRHGTPQNAERKALHRSRPARNAPAIRADRCGCQSVVERWGDEVCSDP